MISSSLESVLIRYPANADRLSFVGVRERSLGNGAGFVADQLLLSALFHFDTVFSFETIAKTQPYSPSESYWSVNILWIGGVMVWKSKRCLYDCYLKLYLPDSVSCSCDCFRILMGSASWGRAEATARQRARKIICKTKRYLKLIDKEGIRFDDLQYDWRGILFGTGDGMQKS